MSTLTPEELMNLIKSDIDATTLLLQRDDHSCARRCSVIAPKIPKELKLSHSGVLRLYKDEPSKGVYINKRLRELAQSSDLIKDIVDFMSHFTPSESYPDFSLPPIRQALTAPVESGGAGFTQDQVQRILDAGVQGQEVSPIEVEFVRTRLWQQ